MDALDCFHSWSLIIYIIKTSQAIVELKHKRNEYNLESICIVDTDESQ